MDSSGAMDLFSFKDVKEDDSKETEKESKDSTDKGSKGKSDEKANGGKLGADGDDVVVENVDASTNFMSMFGYVAPQDDKVSEEKIKITEKAGDVEAASVFFQPKNKPNSDRIELRDDKVNDSGGSEKVTFSSNSNKIIDETNEFFFTADTIEGIVNEASEPDIAKADNEEQTDNSEKLGATIIIAAPNFVTEAADDMKFRVLRKRYESGVVVQQLDENKRPLMLLLQLGTDLMAYRYLGSGFDIEIPAFVGNRPVKHIHPYLLTGGADFITGGLRFKNLKSAFGVDNIADLSANSLKTAFKGIKSIKLPNGLLTIPPKVFTGCMALTSIVIPESVTSISVKAFMGSAIKDIYFNGRCPLGFKYNYMVDKNVRIHYKEEYASSFFNE